MFEQQPQQWLSMCVEQCLRYGGAARAGAERQEDIEQHLLQRGCSVNVKARRIIPKVSATLLLRTFD